MMLFILFLVYCVTLSLAQLDITNQTSLEELTGALLHLGLPNAAEFLTPDERQNASLAASQTGPTSCSIACALLRDMLNLNNSLPHNYNPTYWASQQKETRPTCFVTPGTATYVAGTLLILEYLQCPFAIKSGGSSPFGSSIANQGVVIDLRTFNTISLSRDRFIVTIGTGQEWGRVIDGLGVLGYMVPGANSANVGVGGHILNGGISFASSRYGLAADSVIRYEVVTANGSILNATPTEHYDLYWALRGSGGQVFGLVTRFDILTFPVPHQFFGGIYSTDLGSSSSVFGAFEDFVSSKQDVDNAAQFICTVSPSGTHAILSHLDGTEAPEAFERILAIPPTSSTLKVRTMSDFTREIADISPRGYRELFSTFTVVMHAAWMQDCAKAFIEEATKLRNMLLDRVQDPGLSFDALSPGIINQSMKYGGNPMNLEALADGSYIVAHLGFGWESSSDDNTVIASAKSVLARCMDPAAAENSIGSFVYPGYSNSTQDIWGGFGETNKQRLRAIAQAYDPAGWLRRLQPNGRVIFD